MPELSAHSHFDLASLFGELPRLETPRLYLRAVTLADAPGLLEIYSDEETGRYNAWQSISSLAEAEDMALKFARQFKARERIRWGLARKEDNRLIGDVAFVRFDARGAKAEVGYNLQRGYWGKGYMREALTRVVAHGFRAYGLNRVEALVMPENEASLGLLKRLGFRIEGRMVQAGFVDGKFCDVDLCALLASEFLAGPDRGESQF